MKTIFRPLAKRGPYRSRKFIQAGVTVTVLVFLALSLTAVLVLSNVALTQARISRRVSDRITALSMAESGVDDAVNRIETVSITYAGTATDALFNDSSGWVTLYEDHPNTTRPIGSFRSVVETVTGQTYVRKITSVGRTSNGVETRVIATATINARRIGTAAIMANRDIQVGGTALVNTEPLNQHVADVFANGNIAMGGSSFVDGRLEAQGTVTGTAYYPSVSGSPPMIFPAKAETDEWLSEWLTASGHGSPSRTVDPNRLRFPRNGSLEIRAPAYIDGDLTLNNDESIVFTGASTTSVVYVKGNVRLTGTSSITNGVRLVVGGQFNQQGSTVYRISPPPNTTPPSVSPSLLVVGGTSVYGVNSNADTNTVTLAGSSGTDSAGLVWTLGGSIQVAGGANFRGALVASQPGANVNSNGGYNHWYPVGLWYDKDITQSATVARAIEP